MLANNNKNKTLHKNTQRFKLIRSPMVQHKNVISETALTCEKVFLSSGLTSGFPLGTLISSHTNNTWLKDISVNNL